MWSCSPFTSPALLLAVRKVLNYRSHGDCNDHHMGHYTSPRLGYPPYSLAAGSHGKARWCKAGALEGKICRSCHENFCPTHLRRLLRPLWTLMLRPGSFARSCQPLTQRLSPPLCLPGMAQGLSLDSLLFPSHCTKQAEVLPAI